MHKSSSASLTLRLDGKRTLIVGASRGIGRTIARSMAAQGAHVAVAARGRENLETLCAEVAKEGGTAIEVVADCSLSHEATRAVQYAHDVFGGLDCVVNVAGIHPTWARIGDQPIESWDKVIAINLSGTFYICRAALPILVAGGGGTIVNITSVGAFRSWELVGPYCASKAAVEMLTRTIAHEYARDGVRANCVAPGVIDAGITNDVLGRDPSLRSVMIGMHPLGRLGLAEEVAEAVVWLASDASSFTTGASLAVDGGFLS